MSAHAMALMQVTATEPKPDNHFATVMSRSINLVADRVFDSEKYESSVECRPDSKTIVGAALVLAHLPYSWASTADIEPFMGEISMTWRAGRNRRVKAIISGLRISSYHERIENGRVVEKHLERETNRDYLIDKLNWLRDT